MFELLQSFFYMGAQFQLVGVVFLPVLVLIGVSVLYFAHDFVRYFRRRML